MSGATANPKPEALDDGELDGAPGGLIAGPSGTGKTLAATLPGKRAGGDIAIEELTISAEGLRLD